MLERTLRHVQTLSVALLLTSVGPSHCFLAAFLMEAFESQKPSAVRPKNRSFLFLVPDFLSTQESHTDLREWYVHCLDFLALKRRLIDDPPDPYDDHPSMVGPSSQAGSSFPAGVIDGGSSSAAVSQTNGAISVNLSDSQPEQEGLLLTACGNTSVGPTVEEGGSGLGAGGVAGGGQVAVVFRERSSRVVAFELKQVRRCCREILFVVYGFLVD